MFKKRSKSTPGSSRSASPGPLDLENDLNDLSIIETGEDVPPPIQYTEEECAIDPGLGPRPDDLEADVDRNPDIQYAYTARHPMGNILLKLLSENTRLAEAANIRTMGFSARELSSQFYNAQMLEKRRIKARILQTTEGMENLILTKEMDSHTLNQNIAPPDYFSPVPTLVTARQRADCLKLLPQNKFNGSEKGMSVLEFLNLLKSLQQQCGLSLSEFYEIMLASTTGEAYLLLLAWIENGDEPSTIFHNLGIHYDKRMQPEEARTRLAAYRVPKNSDLAKAEATIQGLAARVASLIPAGPSRTASYNNEIIQGLIRSLPPQSSILVQTQYTEKSAKFSRAITAAELSRFLNIYRHSIDSDIRANGADNRSFEKRYQPRAGNNGVRKYTAFYNMGATSLPQKSLVPQMNRYRGQINQVSRNTPRPLGGNKTFVKDNRYQNNNSNNYNMRKPWSNSYGTQNSNRNNNNRMSGFRANRGRGGNFNRRSFNNNGRSDFKTTGCSLCGQESHRAADGCPNMISDNGARVPVIPTKDTCNNCPQRINPRLSHPPSICPYRKNGPWGNKL